MKKQKQEKCDTSFWDARRGLIHTAKGGWIIGEAIYNQGYSMMMDLVGHASFFQVLFLNAVGYLPERRMADWLEALFNCLSWPDSRIWCNQIGSLAGTVRCSPVAGVSAGILSSDSRMYGPGAQKAGVDFITGAKLKRETGMAVETIVSEYPRKKPGSPPIIPGYVRPVASGDERVDAMKLVTRNLGFATGPHLEVAFLVEAEMVKYFKESMNLLGYAAAFLCDQGLKATEQCRLVSAMVNSGVHACYVEAKDNPPEAFFPLHCNDIDYQGKPPRHVPTRK